jgi:glucoselysine-6-phosphate deglycase
MTETMYDCYVSQFDNLSRLLENKETLLKGFADYYRQINPDRIYLVGSGTSFHACDAASFYMESLLGVEITVQTATAVKTPYGKRPLVIAVSQSGLSTNTRAMVSRLRGLGIPVITLTDPQDTPVSQAASFPVHLQAGDEKIGPKTRGYAATILTLYLLAMEISGTKTTPLRTVVDSGPLYLKTCGEFFEKHKNTLAKARSYIFTGKDAAGKVAAECALKILETVCCPALGYEFEEFLHGPAFSIDENSAVFLFLCSDHDKGRMIKTNEIISRATQNTYIVSYDETIKGDNILTLPVQHPEIMSPFVHVLIGQLISALLPDILNRSRHPAVRGILKEMDTKVQN